MATPSRLAVTPIIATKGSFALFWAGYPTLGVSTMVAALLTAWLIAREFGHRFRNKTTEG